MLYLKVMSQKISVVINTFNEEKNIEKVLNSVRWADEVLVCDMHSSDKTVEIAKKLGAKVILYKQTGYVEPARNFAISKASGDWILVVDADEEIPQTLVNKLKEIASHDEVNFVQIPRKNIIFGKWMRTAMWWPDYNIRFFKKGKVSWTNKIHRPPETEGQGIKLDPLEEHAIVHHNYDSLSSFIIRMDRYTTIQAKELILGGYKFDWTDIFTGPLGEFLSRFFANRGFEDGLHGLALSFLQAFSFLVMYLKVWEREGFIQKDLDLNEIEFVTNKEGRKLRYWFSQSNKSKNIFKTLIKKAKLKMS